MFAGRELLTEGDVQKCDSLQRYMDLSQQMVEQSARMDRLNFHSQLVQAMTAVPAITERHNRDIIALFLDLMVNIFP